MRWIPYAMVRVTAFFAGGIVLCLYFPELLNPRILKVFLIILLAFYLVSYLFLQKTKALNVLTGVIGLAAVFSSGYLNTKVSNESVRADHLVHVREKISTYMVQLAGAAEEKERSWKQSVEVLRVRTSLGWRDVAGKVNLYWPKDALARHFEYGDILLIQGSPVEVRAPANPGEFDLRKFLAYRNIYHQHFLRKDQWHFIRSPDDRGILYYSLRARDWSVAAIKRFVRSPQEQGIVIALVLGVTDGIDDELQSAYAASGAMHVLAVSGLHVSIIYGLLLFFLKPLNNTAAGQWLLACISLVLLWFYAFLTGLSPSVLRAVTMFSFAVIAKPIGKTTNIYNTLGASAFFLLLHDPFLITSVGFQLSYLAVLGIVYLQRPLYKLLTLRWRLMDWAWQLSCVSIGAQAATIPLGLFYFHQFPVYFLVANLFVIPGSFVVLIGGILLLAASPFFIPASWLGFLLEWFVRILNRGVFFVEELPGSLVGDIYISLTQCIFLFVLIVSFILLFEFRKFRYLLLSATLAAAFSAAGWRHLLVDVNSPGFVVYSLPGRSAMEWFVEGQSLFLADSIVQTSNQTLGFHVKPSRLLKGVTDASVTSQNPFKEVQGLRYWMWHGKSFIWINSPEYVLPEKANVNLVLISNNALRSAKELTEHIKFQAVIMDGSNSRRFYERISNEIRGLSVSWVLKDGAFAVTL